MKKHVITALLCLATAPLFAQKLINPEIKAGTVLYYSVFLKNVDNIVQLELTFNDLNDPIKMHWDVPGYGKGEWEMPAESLTSALKTTLEPPEPDKITKMKKGETLLVLSKALYQTAVANNSFQLNDIKFNVLADTIVYRINGKPMASFHAVSENKKAELWILNNPNFPLLISGKNVTRGIDFDLLDVKQK